MNNDFDRLETWSCSAALAQATQSIEIMGTVKPFFFDHAVLPKMVVRAWRCLLEAQPHWQI